MQDSVVVDLVPEQPRPGDLYMLCSDGLSGMITDEEILALTIAANGDPRRAATEMVAMANAHGGEDNITVVCIQIEE